MADFGAALNHKPQRKEDSALSAAAATLKPVVENVSRLGEEKRRAFRTGLARFVRLYNFVTQICRMFDADMHIYSLFAKLLAAALPTEAEGLPDLDGQIDLEYYKLTKTWEGGIELVPAETGFPGIKGDSGAAGEKDFAMLSDIVQKINQRFGTQFDPNDQVHTLRQIAEHVATSDHRLADLAGEEDAGTWNMVYDSVFATGVAEAALSNAAFFELINKTPDALDFLKGQLRNIVKERLQKSILI